MPNAQPSSSTRLRSHGLQCPTAAPRKLEAGSGAGHSANLPRLVVRRLVQKLLLTPQPSTRERGEGRTPNASEMRHPTGARTRAHREGREGEGQGAFTPRGTSLSSSKSCCPSRSGSPSGSWRAPKPEGGRQWG